MQDIAELTVWLKHIYVDKTTDYLASPIMARGLYTASEICITIYF